MCCGHYGVRAIAHKILSCDYYYLITFTQFNKVVTPYNVCMCFVCKKKLLNLTLKPIIMQAPF